ncbi:hypothetical protein ASG11_02015 [Sphingomonas sp. Leaf357]|uniref:hypothetical protein n=1 Tax=Sphingomonas sp. Leaf357 TaxID=1736350 RepID=UPI0006FDDD86|nr:hypothetical protein [Sphingomonas sp. Leaf357]KQS03187.1 hypothetical protein ASG11_02015 [Sphingomonas sp. Leaf357]
MSDFTPTPLVAPAKPRVRWPAIVAASAFFLGLAAMAVAMHYWSVWFPTETAAPVATVKGQLPVVVVPAAGAPAAAAPVIDLNELSKREGELAGRLADLEQRTARVSGDAQAASGYATRAEGMMVAFAARRALDRGLRLGYIEDQLRTRFGTTQPHAVAAILQAAREPVTIAELRAGLDGIGTELVTGQASNGWLHSLRRELGNLVVIHRADTPSPLPVDRLARAKQMLETNKVEAALAEVARMPGAPQAVRWTAAARRYIGARQALDTIEAAAITGQTNPTDIPGTDAPAA